MSTKKRIVVHLFEGFQMLDAFGPLDMLSLLKTTPPADIEVITTSINGEAISPSGSSLKIVPDMKLGDIDKCDLFILPGGAGIRRDVLDENVIEAIRLTDSKSVNVMTVCTGSALLAKTGVLDGLSATSNKLSFNWVMEQGPQVEWKRQARWVEDGKYLTSSGISAGIDCILAYVEREYGSLVTESLCKRSEYVRNANPNDDPFAAPE